MAIGIAGFFAFGDCRRNNRNGRNIAYKICGGGDVGNELAFVVTVPIHHIWSGSILDVEIIYL